MKSVLIVDDNDEIAVLLGDYLAHFGVEPDFAQLGERALELVRANEYDAIVLDLMLPGIDGFETCRPGCERKRGLRRRS